MEQLEVDQPGGKCVSTWFVNRVPSDVIPGSVTDKRHTVKEGWIIIRDQMMSQTWVIHKRCKVIVVCGQWQSKP